MICRVFSFLEVQCDFDNIYSGFYNSEKIERSIHQDTSLAKIFLTMNIYFNYKERERERQHMLEYSTNKQAFTKNEFSFSIKIC